MKNQKFLLISLLFYVFAGISCSTVDEQETQERPNILIFFSDELAFDQIGAYGGNVQTPNIDRLASNGIRFDNAYVAASMCTPSRFALLTGKFPGRCVHPSFLEQYPEDEPYVVAWNTFLDGTLPTIPGILSANGYFTGMTGKWHVGKLPPGKQAPEFEPDASLDDPEVDRKLRDFQEVVKSEVKRTAGFDYAASVLWGNFDVFEFEPLRYHNFPWITYGAVSFLEEAKKQGKPFFLYAATTALHGPSHADAFNHDLRYTLEGRVDEVMKYALPADSMKREIERHSGPSGGSFAGLADLDNHIKLVMRKLKELDLDKNTIVLFMADHNKEPGKATAYERGLNTAFILNWPQEYPGPIVNDKPVSSVDLLPTILEIAGIPLPEDAYFDGVSFLPALGNPGVSTRSYIYGESGLARSVKDGKWKYIAFRYPEDQIEAMRSGEIDYAPNQLNLERQAHSSIAMEHYPSYFDADQLFDLENDPYEQHNLAYKPEYQDKLAEMQDLLMAHLSTFDHPYPIGDTAFMRTEKFKKLTEKSLSYGTDYIPWLRRDHGGIVWPPKE